MLRVIKGRLVQQSPHFHREPRVKLSWRRICTSSALPSQRRMGKCIQWGRERMRRFLKVWIVQIVRKGTEGSSVTQCFAVRRLMCSWSAASATVRTGRCMRDMAVVNITIESSGRTPLSFCFELPQSVQLSSGCINVKSSLARKSNVLLTAIGFHLIYQVLTRVWHLPIRIDSLEVEEALLPRKKGRERQREREAGHAQWNRTG